MKDRNSVARGADGADSHSVAADDDEVTITMPKTPGATRGVC